MSNVLPSGVNNYAETAHAYDEFRRPEGHSLLLDALDLVAERTGIAHEQLAVAAGGCGTCNYEHAILKELTGRGQRVKVLHLLDAFTDMLKQGPPKLEPFGIPLQPHVVDLVSQDFPMLPGSVHYMTLVEMIHHLDRGHKLHPRLEKVLAKVFRALRPGGALSVISTTPTQSVKSRYYQWVGHWGGLDESEDPGKAYADQYPRMEVLIGLLRKVGFDVRNSVGPLPIDGPYIRQDVYYEPKELIKAGPGAVSFFRFAQDRGLHDGYAEVFDELLRHGRMDQVIQESEDWRKTIGTSYCITLFKPVK